jgi:hypothetical protein
LPQALDLLDLGHVCRCLGVGRVNPLDFTRLL